MLCAPCCVYFVPQRNPLNIFAVHELLAQADGSVATKFTVCANLFGGTLIKLGTHHRALQPRIDTMETIGCFGLTELGFGNNAGA